MIASAGSSQDDAFHENGKRFRMKQLRESKRFLCGGVLKTRKPTSGKYEIAFRR
ncbi:hypothetical protein RSSM_00034 [Rhodopirellula sallentina SM41]|uniref:Uncharacterized protein n=1 Tax=Rhodopirellula sallentina SM41 TaxID=1263870 RepID=M5UAP6_9BACT|nr:hypothetical protein RSSM_00034 [Rhodopirellula sallentina SM41]